jgi:hypothetical protein
MSAAMEITRMFIPLMYTDSTGSLFGSEFVELYRRMPAFLDVRRTRRDSDGATQYRIYTTLVKSPVATFDYGAGGVLGTVTFNGPDGSVRTHAISSFLTKVGGSVVVASPCTLC